MSPIISVLSKLYSFIQEQIRTVLFDIVQPLLIRSTSCSLFHHSVHTEVYKDIFFDSLPEYISLHVSISCTLSFSVDKTFQISTLRLLSFLGTPYTVTPHNTCMEYSAGDDGLSLQVRCLVTERNDTLISAGLKDQSKHQREESNCPSCRTPV